MEDIAPQLLRQIQTRFSERVAASPKIRALEQRIRVGTATYEDAGNYAYLIGEALSQALGDFLTTEALPDGRMYYNIAQRVLTPLLEEDHAIVSEAAARVQAALNQKAGIGIKPQIVAADQDRISGIIGKISDAEDFSKVAWVLEEPIKNFSQSIVDTILRENVNFQGKAGLRPKIIRKAEGKCCNWCSKLAGVHDYPDVDEDVYRRHERCRCIVEYDPGDGRRQNVHTKKLTTQGDRDIIEERKRIGLDSLDTFRPKDYTSTIKSYVTVDRDAVVEASRSGKRHGHGGVYTEATRKTKKQLQKSIVSRVSQVERHADKIAHPENYVPDWAEKSPAYQQGLIRKWQKDMRRNAEQAEIELAVFEERYLL